MLHHTTQPELCKYSSRRGISSYLICSPAPCWHKLSAWRSILHRVMCGRYALLPSGMSARNCTTILTLHIRFEILIYDQKILYICMIWIIISHVYSLFFSNFQGLDTPFGTGQLGVRHRLIYRCYSSKYFSKVCVFAFFICSIYLMKTANPFSEGAGW